MEGRWRRLRPSILLRRTWATVGRLLGFEVQRLNARPVSKGRFCDYCTCPDCRGGAPWLRSLPCRDGTNICDVCLFLEPCYDVVAPWGKKRGASVNCPGNPKCKHKPEVIGLEEAGNE